VRKRDISFGPRCAEGVQAWDTFQTLVATARKLGVNIYQYLRDRICGTPETPPLAEVVADRAQDLLLRASWPERAPHPAWHPVDVQTWHR
jgi:hypothetical protein